MSLHSLGCHVLEEEVGYHGDGDDLVGLVDDLGDLLVLDAHHVLPVHLLAQKGEKKWNNALDWLTATKNLEKAST